ncbi:MAG: autotransporter outer membrane beta-barrel domain-containing protein [Alphaproteobacteria bacterium]|nr:autotransporter outer membrane beta-barrel domain-containing protein [Alphaproteobacteria bacterium]
MFNLDGEVGYVIDVSGGSFRPFLGVRYLEWDQDQGFRPDSPPGCCFMNSQFDGIGPRVGFDARLPVSEMLFLVGGADASVLFGNIDFDAGPFHPSTSGNEDRTAITLGGYIGIDFAIAENISLGARYKILYLDGTSFSDQHFNDDPPRDVGQGQQPPARADGELHHPLLKNAR